MPKNNKPELRTGDKFNRLTILSYSHSDKRWRKWYNMKCECGVRHNVKDVKIAKMQGNKIAYNVKAL